MTLTALSHVVFEPLLKNKVLSEIVSLIVKLGLLPLLISLPYFKYLLVGFSEVC